MISEKLAARLAQGILPHAELLRDFGRRGALEIKDLVAYGDVEQENVHVEGRSGRPKIAYKLASAKHQMSKDDLLKNAYQINQDLQLALLCINQANKHLDAAFSAIMKAYPELAEDVQPVTKWS